MLKQCLETISIEFFQTLALSGIRKIAPYENSPLWKLPPVEIVPQNFSPDKIDPLRKLPPMKSCPYI